MFGKVRSVTLAALALAMILCSATVAPVPQARADSNGVYIKCEDYVTIHWNGDMGSNDWVALYDHSPQGEPDNNYLTWAYVTNWLGTYREKYETSYKNTSGDGYYVAYYSWSTESRKWRKTGSSGPTKCP